MYISTLITLLQRELETNGDAKVQIGIGRECKEANSTQRLEIVQGPIPKENKDLLISDYIPETILK